MSRAEHGSKNQTPSETKMRSKSIPPLNFRNKGKGDGESGQKRDKQNLTPTRPIAIPM